MSYLRKLMKTVPYAESPTTREAPLGGWWLKAPRGLTFWVSYHAATTHDVFIGSVEDFFVYREHYMLIQCPDYPQCEVCRGRSENHS